MDGGGALGGGRAQSLLEEQLVELLGFHGQIVLHLVRVGPEGDGALKLGAGRLPVNVLLQDVIVFYLVVESRVVHPDEHVVDAQEVAQEYEEARGHHALLSEKDIQDNQKK